MGQRMPIFMGDVPTYKVVGDHMHIIWRELEIVLAVSTMLAGMDAARREIDEWRVDQSGKVESIHAAMP